MSINMSINMSTIAINATTNSCTALAEPTFGTDTETESTTWLILLFLGFYTIYTIYTILRKARSRKAFSAARGLLADHGLVTAKLFIETESGLIFGTPPNGNWESFNIVFGSGASLDDPGKGINANWSFLDHEKLSKMTGPFTSDAVTAYNSLWQTLYPSALNLPHFNVDCPETFAETTKQLEEFLIANPHPTAAAIEVAMVDYIGHLILAVEKHLGLPKALELHAAIWPEYAGSLNEPQATMAQCQNCDLQFKTPSSFYAACVKNIFTKPAVLLRDFSSLIGWQPIGGFAIEGTNSYGTQAGVRKIVTNAIPSGGVLSLAEGLDSEWLDHPHGKRFCSNPNTSTASPCSVHWNDATKSEGWTVMEADARWIASELAEERQNQYDDQHSPKTIAAVAEYLRALKDAYVVTLTLKHSVTGVVTTLRYGQVHFDSTKVSARKYVLPALVEMVNKYDLHAIGGDTNVTASKDDCQHTVSDVAKSLRRISMGTNTYPYPIEKTRLPGDLLMNSQTLTKYGTTCEHDGMLAATA